VRRWWQATEGIRFILILLAAILLWVLVVLLIRSS
jgi:hypothetical protein